MKRFFAALTLCTAVSVFSMTALAQSPMLPPPGGDFPDWISPGLRDDLPARRRGPEVHREPRVIKNGPLAPSIDDRIAFTTFLKDKNTGLIRLLPREVYDTRSYRVEQKLKVRGGGAYFSFANLTHHSGFGSDIEFHKKKLSVGTAGSEFGMLTDIGDTPLEQITWDSVRTRYIAAYRPPRYQLEAREEYRRLSSGDGKTLDGVLYHTSLPVHENSTYLLRSIAYYHRSDVLVAFRLARKDTDGSVIIAWRLLKRYPSPKLKRN